VGILSKLLCCGLCDKCSQSAGLGAAVKGLTNWVCQIGTLKLCLEAVA